MAAELAILRDELSSLSWGKLSLHYLSFLSHFAIVGALGFRFLVLRRMASSVTAPEAGDPAGVLAAAERGAARIGLGGTLLLLVYLTAFVARNAAAQHITTLGALRDAKPGLLIQFLCGLLLVVAFSFAARQSTAAWNTAACAGATIALRNMVTGNWTAVLNALHEVAASLWLGTLFVLVAVGLPAILAGACPGEGRGRRAADLVRWFSPVALCSAVGVAVTGVTTAYVHLKYVAALWTTTYGYALGVKLSVVGIVVALGAWHWRRLLPRLGSEGAAHALGRSAKVELAFAAVILMLTAVLLNLPKP